jgi:2'-5' RNA ligase
MLSAFPNLRQPRAIWCGIATGLETLKLIVSEIEKTVTTLGFPKEEKAFKAHLTIGRVREGADSSKLVNFLIPYRVTPIPLSLDRIVLFKSTLTPTGPIYERLHTCELGKTIERFE